MEWPIIAALVIAIPVILFPAAFIWFINISGLRGGLERKPGQRKTGGRSTPVAPVKVAGNT